MPSCPRAALLDRIPAAMHAAAAIVVGVELNLAASSNQAGMAAATEHA